MLNTLRNLGTLTVLVVTGLTLHSPLAAQSTRVLSAPTLSAAEQLELQAEQPITNGDHGWLMAANELAKAAKLRAPTDPTAVTDLVTAGTLYESVGRHADALDALDLAGSRAVKIGENAEAAHAYVAAFNVAVKLEDEDIARQYLDRATKAAEGPGVSFSERQAILGPQGIPVETCN